MTPTYSGKRVLLTGASGFIGANVLKYMLKHTDFEFVCLASWRHMGNPLRLQGLGDRVIVVTHDLRGPVPDLGEFDYILNLASESHVDRSIQDPVPFIENNVSIALNMLEYARAHPCLAFIQFSTDEVYGSNDANETHDSDWGTIVPSNPYAASKAAQEAIAISYWRTYGVPVIITNANNIIGPGQDAEKFVPRIVDAIKNGRPITIHVHNGDFGYRIYTPVDNTSDALLFLLENVDPSIKVQRPLRFNLGGGTELSNLEMAQAIARILKRRPQYDYIDVGKKNGIRPGYDKRYFGDDSSIRALGWTPPITFEDGLRDLLKEGK